MALDTEVPKRDPSSGLYEDVLGLVSEIFGVHLEDVIRAYRRLEIITNYTNVVGRQNLLEALSHVAKLFAEAPSASRDRQLEQVAHSVDHFRRVLMEGAEQDVYVALYDILGHGDPHAGVSSGTIGVKYHKTVAPLIARGKLQGFITPTDVLRRQNEIADRVGATRDAKVADGEWELWKSSARELETAAKELRTLRQEMAVAVGAAEIRSRDTRLWVGGIVLGALAAVGLDQLITRLV